MVLHGVAAPASLVSGWAARVGRRNFDCECSEGCKHDAAACCAASSPQSAQLLAWFCVWILRVVLHGVAAPVSLVTRCTARVGRRNFDCECSERCKYDAAACCAASLPQSAKLRVPLVRADELPIAVMPAAFFGESGSQRPLRVK